MEMCVGGILVGILLSKAVLGQNDRDLSYQDLRRRAMVDFLVAQIQISRHLR